MSELTGRIHSFESFGTLDGPGIRFVIFLAGCHLRCKYCHNIDMVVGKDAMEMTVENVMAKILPNKPYFQSSGGGITISGGDPAFQPAFVKALLKRCKEEGLHTAVDTSLYTTREVIDGWRPHVDLFMVSVKQLDDQKHRELTTVSNENILKNLAYLTEVEARLWIRYLVLPGYTDGADDLDRLVEFLKTLRFEKLELLPYHTMGVSKWKKLELPYELVHIKAPSDARVKAIRDKLEAAEIPVLLTE